jgi:hypothetical protein
MPQTSTELKAELKQMSEFTGKHAVFFVFKSNVKEKSLCTLEEFVFE